MAMTSEAVEKLIRAHGRLFPSHNFDGNLHIYLSDGVLMYGDTAGCAELDPDFAAELAAELEALDPEQDDLYEVANEAVMDSGAVIEETVTW